MKKKVWILLLLSLSALLFSQQELVCGDVNSDGTANIMDALLIAQYYVGMNVDIITDTADVNCSESIDIIDALLIAKKYVGLITIDCRCLGLPCAGVPLDHDIDETEDFSFYLRDRADFDLFSNEISAEANNNIIEVKFLILNIKTNPTLYFLNTKRNLYHYFFTTDVLGNTQSLGYFNSVTYFNTTRENIAGTIIYYENYEIDGVKTGIYSLEFVPTFHVPFEYVNLAYQKISCQAAFLNPDNFYYQPVGPVQEFGLKEEQEAFDQSGFHILKTADLYKDITFNTLNEGEGIGFLRVYGEDPRPLTVRDIVILDTIPNDMSHVGGIITTLPQTPLSHINLKAKQNNTPNIFIKNALDNPEITQYLNEYVYFRATNDGFQLRQASREEFLTHLDNIRPSDTQYPVRDLSVQDIRPLYNMGFEDSSAFGVKASNLAELLKILPDGMVPKGYAVPFYFYDRFMEENNLYLDAVEMMAAAEFQDDPAFREEALKSFRKRIKDAPVSSEIAEQLNMMHQSFPQGTSLRCRSSTNNEDLEDFNGAGLYESKTHHPDEGHISKTMKQVWASLWTFRAFEERDFYRIDHLSAAMGVLVHPNFEDEKVNGVAVTKNLYDPYMSGFYVNAQLGEDLVTNPEERSIPEAFVLMRISSFDTYEQVYLSRSNKIEDDQFLLDSNYIGQMTLAMETIHEHFGRLYASSGVFPWDFGMDLEFKVTRDDVLVIKQARPWVD